MTDTGRHTVDSLTNDALDQLYAERDRYRAAWQSAAFRAEARGESIERLCDDRDSYKGWMEQEQAHSAALRARVAELEKSDAINAEVDARTEEQLNSCTEVVQYYRALAERTQAWGEQQRDRANRFRARTEAVRAELAALNSEIAGLNPYAMAGRRDAVARVRAALQSVSHNAPVPDDPHVTELEAELVAARSTIDRVRAVLDGADRYDDMDIIRGALDQAQQPAAGQARCPSCEHEPRYHSDPAGCWFTVLDGKPDRDAVCGCRRPARPLKQQTTTTEA